MALEGLVGAMLAGGAVPFFALATLNSLRNYSLSNSVVWFCVAAAAGLGGAAALFWFVNLLAPHIAVLAMVLALLVQLSGFAFLGLYMARKRVVERLHI